MNRLTIAGLSKGLIKKLQLARKLVEAGFSQPAQDVHAHHMLVALQEKARGKDRVILNAVVPESKKDLLKSARTNAILADLLEQMKQHPEFDLAKNTNTLISAN